MRTVLIAAVSAWMLAAMPATAQKADTGEAAAQAHVEATAQAIRAGDLTKAAAEDDLALAAYQALYAGEKRLIYCGMNTAEAIAYMGMAGAAKRDAIAIAPGWCDAIYFKGYLAVEAGNIGEARRYYEQVLRMAPMHWQYLTELGYTYRNSDPAKSLDYYTQAEGGIGLIDNAQQAKAIAIVRHGKGYALSELKRYDEAASFYQLALKDDPNDQIAIHELGYIAQQRHK